MSPRRIAFWIRCLSIVLSHHDTYAIFIDDKKYNICWLLDEAADALENNKPELKTEQIEDLI